MSKPKILITVHDVPQVALDLLGEKCELIVCDRQPGPTREDILDKAAGVDAIFWWGQHKLDQSILDAAGPQMKVVSTMSAGLDKIDLEALKANGVKLGYTPLVLNDAVADLAVLLTIGASRRAHEGRKCIETGDWKSNAQWMLGTDISESTVGVVGLGEVGQAIVKRLSAFGVSRFIYSGHREKEEGQKLKATFVSFDDLLRDSDFVIVSCPLTDETRGMFNDDAFSKMKRTAVFVNIARGGIVDQVALTKALREGIIFSAGLDVMTPEPLPTNDELLELPNVVMTPHLGSATVKTRAAMAQLCAQNILRGLGGQPMITPAY